MTAHRAARVADEVLRGLARLVREEMRDPRIGFVTLTGVEVSPDLKHARVHVSFLAHDDPVAGLAALNRAAPFLRRALAHEIQLRFTPELKFLFDSGVESGSRIEDILRSIHGSAPENPTGPRDEDVD